MAKPKETGPPRKAAVVEVAGRKFRFILNSTLEHDWWVMGLIQDSGLDPNQFGQRDGEQPGDAAIRLLRAALSSGHAFKIMGGLLIDANLIDMDWTPEHAQQTAEFFRSLSDPTEKASMQTLLVQILISFFSTGRGFKNSSSTSLNAATPTSAHD
jgi:hypothetical protein